LLSKSYPKEGDVMKRIRAYFLTPLVILVTAFSSPAFAEGEWTEWVVDNFNGSVKKAIPSNPAHIAELQVREQAGYGLVNLRIRYEVSQNKLRWSNWATGNLEGNRKKLALPPGAKVIGIEVREQSGYGLINARLIYRIGNQSKWTPWITSNQKGHTAQQMCQGGAYGKGTRVREQAGYGIVNAQLYCQWQN
jgi:hypothetical protein